MPKHRLPVPWGEGPGYLCLPGGPLGAPRQGPLCSNKFSRTWDVHIATLQGAPGKARGKGVFRESVPVFLAAGMMAAQVWGPDITIKAQAGARSGQVDRSVGHVERPEATEAVKAGGRKKGRPRQERGWGAQNSNPPGMPSGEDRARCYSPPPPRLRPGPGKELRGLLKRPPPQPQMTPNILSNATTLPHPTWTRLSSGRL